ncbi:hypothetical protein AAC387_Pa02g1209 [Persea americana]
MRREGTVIVAMSKIENDVDKAHDIEALTALRALQLTYYNGVSNIILESYFIWVVDALKSSSQNMSRQGLTFGEIKDLLNLSNNLEVQRVGREVNGVVHNFADMLSILTIWQCVGILPKI